MYGGSWEFDLVIDGVVSAVQKCWAPLELGVSFCGVAFVGSGDDWDQSRMHDAVDVSRSEYCVSNFVQTESAEVFVHRRAVRGKRAP